MTVISAATYTGPRCQRCGGPCLTWKGSVWGYTCRTCISSHLAAVEAKLDAKAARQRERLLDKLSQTNVTNTDQRRAVVPVDMFRPRPALIATDNPRSTP